MLLRYYLAAAAGILAGATTLAQIRPQHKPAPALESAASPTMPLYEGLGATHHSVTTTSPLAQEYFDQGLAFTYGFNHQEAERSFRQALRFDRHMAMAYWGIALALGPNYNLPGDKKRGRNAYIAIKRARSLENRATPEERNLIEALAQRYGADGMETATRDQAYADAMRRAAHRYPADPDAQTLFAESLMDLHPWMLWSNDGKPGPDTLEIVATIETVLKKNPNHIGANHYYIHAVEASSDPTRAMANADRLRYLAPAAGHLVHMPSHIYIHAGRYHDASTANLRAIAADRSLIKATGETGVYPAMYLTHNVQFLCYTLMMEGRERDAIHYAREAAAMAPVAMVRNLPMAEIVDPLPYLAMARFGEWREILREKPPPNELKYTTGMWHYARGMALQAIGEPADARRERKLLEAIATATPANRIVDVTPAKSLLNLASTVLAAEIAAGRGDHDKAIAWFADAAHLQDNLPYYEPPAWYFPVREVWGAELLAAGKPLAAESVYREDLRRNPGNPRSLFGLTKCLHAEGKTQSAAKVEAKFRDAWRFADSKPMPIRAVRPGG